MLPAGPGAGWDDECVTAPAAEPVVSVVLCTHNGAAFIGEQVASILAQTRLPDELVLGDDASTDGTVELVEPRVEPYRRCRVVEVGRR